MKKKNVVRDSVVIILMIISIIILVYIIKSSKENSQEVQDYFEEVNNQIINDEKEHDLQGVVINEINEMEEINNV